MRGQLRGRNLATLFGLLAVAVAASGCDDEPAAPAPQAIAEGIFATPGQIRPSATAEQRATFERGEAVAIRRFTPSEGLGPDFNVTFCAACHEKPVFGGAAAHYRNFLLRGQTLADGSFLFGGRRGGVLATFGKDAQGAPTRPHPDAGDDTFAVRNPIPFFGVGLIAEIDEAAILANVDPDDANGDGIRGRPNYDKGFVGRFGMKSQTVSIEGFIRGPLNNHLGLTSNPLSPELQAALPVPSVAEVRDFLEAAEGLTAQTGGLAQARFHQAAAPAAPLTDDDDVADPELAEADLYDLVSWAMLLGAPKPAEPTAETEAGRAHFSEFGCAACHVPALSSPRGLIPLYSDLLLHDMGDANADGIFMGLAGPNDFRTAPLWGIGVAGPYLHDGSAFTLEAAVEAHGGEGAASRQAFLAASDEARSQVVAFLLSLGGTEVATEGLLHAGSPPPTGEAGAPLPDLDDAGKARFEAGRRRFDRDHGFEEGVGPHFNGDSCRACHFDPVIGGSGPLDLNVARTGLYNAEGGFTAPSFGTVLPRHPVPGVIRHECETDAVFELRQSLSLLGIGVLAGIPDESILAAADPTDLDGDGIAGVAQMLPDGRLGRFGWKAQVVNIPDFVGDALRFELGLTIPAELGITTAITADDDAILDPEFPAEGVAELTFFLQNLAPPPHAGTPDPAGRAIFEQLGCAACHIPALPGTRPGYEPFTDLLLHRMYDDTHQGVPDGVADGAQYRTPPLWGIRFTGPYLHDGRAETLSAALDGHGGEATASREAWQALSASDRERLLDFLKAI